MKKILVIEDEKDIQNIIKGWDVLKTPEELRKLSLEEKENLAEEPVVEATETVAETAEKAE